MLNTKEFKKNIQLILTNPEKAILIQEEEDLIKLIIALPNKINKNNFDCAIKYIKKLPLTIQVCIIKICIEQDFTISHTNGFINWASNPIIYKHVLG